MFNLLKSGEVDLALESYEVVNVKEKEIPVTNRATSIPQEEMVNASSPEPEAGDYEDNTDGGSSSEFVELSNKEFPEEPLPKKQQTRPIDGTLEGTISTPSSKEKKVLFPNGKVYYLKEADSFKSKVYIFLLYTFLKLT